MKPLYGELTANTRALFTHSSSFFSLGITKLVKYPHMIIWKATE